MNFSFADLVKGYLRELSSRRGWIVFCFFVISLVAIPLVLTWPKSYTSTSSIYADNSDILGPLMKGTAIATNTLSQARIAKEILFKREFTDQVLEAGGWDIEGLSVEERGDLIAGVKRRTRITNVGRNPTRLIRISSTDEDPIRAFRVAQIYTTIFIEQSVIEKQSESQGAFEFIRNQVTGYQLTLQESEAALSRFKSENNLGSLKAANSRIGKHRTEIKKIELELEQLIAQQFLVASQLAGEIEISADLGKVNQVRGRINSLQLQLDVLRSKFYDDYPDVIQIKTQMQDLMDMIDTGKFDDFNVGASLSEQGVSPLEQELKSRQASLYAAKETREIQLAGVESMLDQELGKAIRINDSEAELAELTREYNVTRKFYNNLLGKQQTARISVALDEEQQGVTFKVQEPAIIPVRPNGLGFSELLMFSFVAALAVPLGLLVLYMELDPRIKSESGWKVEWPPLLMTVPPLKSLSPRRISNMVFVGCMFFLALGLYGAAWAVNADLLNLSILGELMDASQTESI